MAKAPIGPPWPTAFKLLVDNGYDSHNILADTVDEFGYDEVQRRPDGGARYEKDGIVTVRREWHSEQFGLDLMDAIWKDEGLS